MLLRRSTSSFRAPEGTSDWLPHAQESSLFASPLPSHHCSAGGGGMHILADVDDGDAVFLQGSYTNRWQHCVLVLFTSEASQIDHAQVVDVLSGPRPLSPSSFMPCLLLTFPESGVERTEWRSRPGTGRRDYKVRSEEESRRGRESAERGAHKGLNAEWGKLPSRASFKGFYGIKERVQSGWPSRAWASLD